MPRIFDNIDKSLLPALRETLEVSQRADFCVGYFNLRGWKAIDDLVEKLPGANGNYARLLVGMVGHPSEELREALRQGDPDDSRMTNGKARELRDKLARDFRDQLAFGAPNDADEVGLKRLSQQLKDKKLQVKLFLAHPLHAKLYLCFRQDANNPRTAFLGSSNLSMAGLAKQGELNVDVLEHEATETLAKWFEDRWADRWCLDITKQLIDAIDESWARPEQPTPYEIYVKMAYHLSEEARSGISQFDIPEEMRGRILPFQAAAVRIAARHVDRRNGVLLGDVVGLGKTLMATTLARILQEPPWRHNTLILCGKNLTSMWQGYVDTYKLAARVISTTRVETELPKLGRFSLVILDESHNFRNPEGKRYQVIRDYIARNDSQCILLSATPYNMAFRDLGSQLRLWVNPEDALPVRPEAYIRAACDGNVATFLARHQCAPETLAAFEKSDFPDDWRELMRLYMVRRTRSFIERHYAEVECPDCGSVLVAGQDKCPGCDRAKTPTDRRFLVFGDGKRFHFPKRIPKTVNVPASPGSLRDQYAQLYSSDVVERIGNLTLARYGLALYLKEGVSSAPSNEEAIIIENLGRAGKRLIGFCRTNLFKRLESSGSSFLLSVRRHIARNYLFIHALESGQPIPIGAQDNSLFSTQSYDADSDPTLLAEDEDDAPVSDVTASSLADFAQVGASAYDKLRSSPLTRLKWLAANRFKPELATSLREDATSLYEVLRTVMTWNSSLDQKLKRLYQLLSRDHGTQKVLVFTQFADTATYLGNELRALGLTDFDVVVGGKQGAQDAVKRFSPRTRNDLNVPLAGPELRVLIATDVLSEGQNLQDCAVVVNYDLPWAIIRLIQRAGRVDRIGQEAEQITAYSFVPAEGIDQLIALRRRITSRLSANAEVLGADERFFEDESYDEQRTRDIFTELAGSLDDDPNDDEVDLESYAFQVWQDAISANRTLEKSIPALPPLVYSTKSMADVELPVVTRSGFRGAGTRTRHVARPGVIAFVRNADGVDGLAWLDETGAVITESQHAILRGAACAPDTVTRDRLDGHHDLVIKAASAIERTHRQHGGQLGRKSSPRFRAYERLTEHARNLRGLSVDSVALDEAIKAIYSDPLTNVARERLDAVMRHGASDERLADLAVSLHADGRLCITRADDEKRDPVIICSLGIREG